MLYKYTYESKIMICSKTFLSETFELKCQMIFTEMHFNINQSVVCVFRAQMIQPVNSLKPSDHNIAS